MYVPRTGIGGRTVQLYFLRTGQAYPIVNSSLSVKLFNVAVHVLIGSRQNLGQVLVLSIRTNAVGKLAFVLGIQLLCRLILSYLVSMLSALS